MWNLRQFLRRHSLWAGGIIVLVPLVLLLRLQYGWLVKLEEASTLARQATLDNYLESLTTEIEFWFKGNAERALNIPATYFSSQDMARAAYHLRKKGAEGARRLFLVNYAVADSEEEDIYIFDAVNWESPAPAAEVKAVMVALAPWKVMVERGLKVSSAALSVDERDPANRIILNPITDERGKVVGVAGMILDNDQFRDALLPAIIESHSTSQKMSTEFAVMVWDSEGHPVLGNPEDWGNQQVLTSNRGFDFVFTDWSLALRSTHPGSESLARSNLALNVGLAGLLALVILAGIILALRTAFRERRLSQMKTDFVSNVSHELRTPLSSIRVFGEFLRLGRVDTPDKLCEYGEYIESESRRLTQLINNILDFSKIESGGKTYRFVPGDIKDVVVDTLRTFQVRLQHNGFSIDFQSPAVTLPPIPMDAQAMTQAVSNLLDNAVKYSDGSRDIQVRLYSQDGSVILSVTDQGMGISAEEQGKIFERFHRVSTGLVHDVKGSGLGLAIVSHIVQAHGGRVTVASEPGQGSTFSIHLPMTAASAPA